MISRGKFNAGFLLFFFGESYIVFSSRSFSLVYSSTSSMWSLLSKSFCYLAILFSILFFFSSLFLTCVYFSLTIAFSRIYFESCCFDTRLFISFFYLSFKLSIISRLSVSVIWLLDLCWYDSWLLWLLCLLSWNKLSWFRVSQISLMKSSLLSMSSTLLTFMPRAASCSLSKFPYFFICSTFLTISAFSSSARCLIAARFLIISALSLAIFSAFYFFFSILIIILCY